MTLSRFIVLTVLVAAAASVYSSPALAATREITISKDDLMMISPMACNDGDADRAGRTGSSKLGEFPKLLSTLKAVGRPTIETSLETLDTARPDHCVAFMAALGEAKTLKISQSLTASASTPGFDGLCQPLMIEYVSVTTESDYQLFAGYNSIAVLAPSKASCQ